ncbi:hypothetical protein PCANB_001485 [Pneumocystis canis]|nr:hypothetical protein PCANB_001485 [Pneumocystis canis]
MKSNKNTKLVIYDSTDDEIDDNINRKVPSLPDFFLDLYQGNFFELKKIYNKLVKPMMGEDPIFHEGRKRTYPHIQGGWPGHIYICLSSEGLQNILKKIHKLCEMEGLTFISLFENELGMSLSLHISLSKPFILTSNMIDAFRDIMKTSIVFKSFDINFSNISIFTNDDSSRTFLVLIIDTGRENLQAILRIIDSNPQFHVSIAWCLGRIIIDQTILNRLNNKYAKQLSMHKLHINKIKMKIGNIIHSIPAIS